MYLLGVNIQNVFKNSYNSIVKKKKTIKKWRKDLNRHFSKDDTKKANRYMRICSTTLVITEMQAKSARLSC